MREVMRRYHDAVTGVITRHEGYVANYLGDGVLAYFGWPHAHEDQAAQAVRAGLKLAHAVSQITVPGSDGETLAARVGIATGQVVVGDLIGEGASQQAAVTGETPNLASRLQGTAEPGEVVIGGVLFMVKPVRVIQNCSKSSCITISHDFAGCRHPSPTNVVEMTKHTSRTNIRRVRHP